jgi:hypothetical protein
MTSGPHPASSTQREAFPACYPRGSSRNEGRKLALTLVENEGSQYTTHFTTNGSGPHVHHTRNGNSRAKITADVKLPTSPGHKMSNRWRPCGGRSKALEEHMLCWNCQPPRTPRVKPRGNIRTGNAKSCKATSDFPETDSICDISARK